MSRRRTALDKLSRAARLSEEAARLYAEATEELAQADETEVSEQLPPVTEMDRARARRALRKLGAGP